MGLAEIIIISLGLSADAFAVALGNGLCGAMNGFMVTVMGLIPFIATLGGMCIYSRTFILINRQQAAPVNPTIEPSDKSIPPPMITMLAPIATMT